MSLLDKLRKAFEDHKLEEKVEVKAETVETEVETKVEAEVETVAEVTKEEVLETVVEMSNPLEEKMEALAKTVETLVSELAKVQALNLEFTRQIETLGAAPSGEKVTDEVKVAMSNVKPVNEVVARLINKKKNLNK